MKADDYLLEYDNIKDLSIKILLETLSDTNGKKLNDLKVRDLTYHNKNKIFPGEGVYIFREDISAIYVGKVSSMSFTERIAKHFDLREVSWFNRLLKLLCERELKIPVNNENLKTASEYAFQKLNLVLINFKNRDRINRTERLLRSCMEPLNKFKYLEEKNLGKIVSEY